MEEAGVKLIAQGIAAYLGDLKSAERATNGFVDATDKGSGRISAAGSVITGALEKIGHVAVDAFLQAGKAAVSFVGDSIDLAGDFEASMLEFQSVAGRDVDTSGLEDFRDLFLDIGKRLPVSTSEVQQAAIEMVKGGIDPATIAAGGLERNIQFAAAAMQGDLVKAAEISSKIMGGWAGVGATAAEKAEFLSHATDMLAKAANASATDVEGLSLGIFNAQGIARTAGVSFDDLTTTLAALAPRFESSSVAGNSLKNMIARLQPTTDPAIQAMSGLGLYTEETGSAFYDATGNFVGFETAAQLLKDSLTGLTKEQQAATLQQIFGNDAMGAAAALAELGAAGYQEMADALANANGVADAAALKQQGLNVAIDNAKGSIEALQITIGSALSPVLESLLNTYISPLINKATDLAAAIFGDEDAFNTLSPALQSVVTFVDDVSQAVGDLVGMFDQGITVSSDLGGAIDDLSGVWQKAGAVVDAVLAGYQDIIDSVLPQVQAFIDDHGDEILIFFQETWDSIIEIVGLALDLYEQIVPPVLHAIAQFIDDHGSEIQRILDAVWDTATTIIGGALDLIKGTIKLATDIINGDWDAAWTDVQNITETITNTISGVVEGFLNVIAGFFDTSVDEIVDLWQNNWDQLVDIATQTDWAAVGRDVVDGIIAGLASAWSSLVGWITDRMGSLVDAGLEAIGAGSPAVKWMPVGQFSVQGVMEGFRAAWPGLTSLVSGLGDDLISQAKDLANNVQQAIADSFSAGASIDRQIARNLDAIADAVLPAYAEWTQGALKQAQAEAERFADPAEASRYFKLRSDQILEYAKLQKTLSEAETTADRERIRQQMLLINAAQSKEISAFQAGQAGKGNPLQELSNAMQNLLGNPGMPGLLESDAMRQITALLSQLQTLASSGYASPPASYTSPPASTTTSNQRTYNMPIYTNNTPEALQQSLALAGAMYP